MLIEHPGARAHLLGALTATPEIIESLLRGLSEAEADFRPDTARFTLREVVAHLAEWDAIFAERLQLTRDENEPALFDFDQGQLAVENCYADSDVGEQLRLFSQRRTQIFDFANTFSAEQWQRIGRHPRVGRMTLEALVILIPLHDAYHLQQIVEWRRLFAAR